MKNDVQAIDLRTQAELLLHEARMVLPGIQTLFGFQLVAVFNPRFGNDLSALLQRAHFISLLLTAVAIALIMTPAAWQRLVEPEQVSRRFIVLGSRYVTTAMAVLMLSLSLDASVVTSLVFDGATAPAVVCGAVLALGYSVLWFAWPSWSRRRE
jgi:hypothetical protein